jgi:Leucine rich repeat
MNDSKNRYGIRKMMWIVYLGLGIIIVNFASQFLITAGEYKFLFRKIYSQDLNVYPGRKSSYELAPVIKGRVYQPNYFYWPERKQYLVKGSVESPSQMDTDSGHSENKDSPGLYVLLDEKGHHLASFDTKIYEAQDRRLYFSRYSGIFFDSTYYVDWLYTGSTERKPYKQIINQEFTLDWQEFLQRFDELNAQAERKDYTDVGIVFKIKGEWILLADKWDRRIHREYTDEDPYTAIWDQTYRLSLGEETKKLEKYQPSPAVLIPLRSESEDPFRFTNAPFAAISIKRFDKKDSYFWYSTNGVAYVKIKIRNSHFKIKIPGVEKMRFLPFYNLGVRTFTLSPEYGDNLLVFVESRQNWDIGGAINPGTGVYVVREREGENFSIPNDLPEGITEKRFNRLPINLQKALINRDTAPELILEDYEIHQWLPEIELLENLKYLEIKGGLTQLPESISKLSKLQMLDLSMNKIRKLPSSFSQLKHLRYVYLSFTELEQFPAELLALPELRKLDLGHNPFTEIPPQISQLKNLIELDLSGAKVTKLPDSMAEMKQLTITTGQYSEYHEQFPEKFQHLFVNKVPHRWDPKPSNESTEQTSN